LWCVGATTNDTSTSLEIGEHFVGLFLQGSHLRSRLLHQRLGFLLGLGLVLAGFFLGHGGRLGLGILFDLRRLGLGFLLEIIRLGTEFVGLGFGLRLGLRLDILHLLGGVARKVLDGLVAFEVGDPPSSGRGGTQGCRHHKE
jgi:hypothetical protein